MLCQLQWPGLFKNKIYSFDKIVPECEELGEIRWPSRVGGNLDCSARRAPSPGCQCSNW